MAIGDDVQHWYRMLTVRTPFFSSHPPILDPSLSGRLYAGRSSDYRCICSLFVTRIGPLAVTGPRGLMTYNFFFLPVVL